MHLNYKDATTTCVYQDGQLWQKERDCKLLEIVATIILPAGPLPW